MKNLLALICGLIFFTSCFDSNAPKNLIDKEDMVNVLIDMHLADASLDYIGQDSLLILARSKYNYLFKKHNIDSAAFTNSLKYYSNTKDFGEIYTHVWDSLSLMNEPDIPRIQKFKRFIPDRLKFGYKKINKIKRDSLARPDSLVSLKKLEPAITQPVIIKDTTSLDRYLIKTDSLNTVKLLGIGIDF